MKPAPLSLVGTVEETRQPSRSRRPVVWTHLCGWCDRFTRSKAGTNNCAHEGCGASLDLGELLVRCPECAGNGELEITRGPEFIRAEECEWCTGGGRVTGERDAEWVDAQ